MKKCVFLVLAVSLILAWGLNSAIGAEKVLKLGARSALPEDSPKKELCQRRIYALARRGEQERASKLEMTTTRSRSSSTTTRATLKRCEIDRKAHHDDKSNLSWDLTAVASPWPPARSAKNIKS